MNQSVYRIVLDLHSDVSQHVFKMKRRDTARQLHFTFTDGGKPWTPSEGCYAMFTAKNPDGEPLLKDCTVEGSAVVFDAGEAVTHVAGELACELRLYSPAGELLTSPRFTIWVEDTVCSEEDENALQDNADALSSLIGEAVTARDAAKAAASNANAVADTVSRAYEDGQLKGEKGDKGDKGDKGEAPETVLTYEEQKLTDAQQAQARKNLGAMACVADDYLDMNGHDIWNVPYISMRPKGKEGFCFYADGFEEGTPVAAFGGTIGDEDVRLRGIATPVNDADVANKAYVKDITEINTIVASASGNCVAVADASSQPLRKLLLTGCVGGDTGHVKVCGKNLFDREKVYPAFLAENTDIKPAVGGYYIDLFAGTQGQNTAIPSEYLSNLPYLPAGTYTMSFQTTGSILNAFAVSADGTVGEKLTSSTLGNTFTLSAGTYITLRKAGNDKTTVYSDVQIEAGGQATAYEAYMSQTVGFAVADDATTVDVLAEHPELHGYKPNTTVITDVDAVIEVEYVVDPKAYIDNKFAQLAAVLATG